MPISICRVPETTIFLVNMYGAISLAELRSNFARFAALAGHLEEPLYRVADLNDITTDYSTVMQLADLMVASLPGSCTDRRITDVFVSKQVYPQLPFALMTRHGKTVPLFHTEKQALSAIYAITDAQQSAQPQFV